ncbi:phage portal protein [Escherichia coli]|nr:phage portal protein [Escherichia coli]OKV98346.1 phage portal protein [Escherichia coli]
MDRELKNLTLNISQLAALSGVHRQTAAARLQNLPVAGGHESNLKLYRVVDIVSAFLALPPPVAEGEMDAHERKAWYQSERERLKFEQETAQLIPASDVRREFAIWAKAVVQVLETLPDILERDCGLQPAAVSRVQSIIDDLRDQIPAGEVLMAILDDVIGVFSPGWKAARLRSRAVIQAYEAVKTTRTHKARRENRTADQLSQYGAVSLREQARYLDNNHDLAIGVFDKLEERVVGKNGIIVEPHPVLRNGAIARDLAAEIRTRWSEWSVSPEVTGQFTRPMLERLMLRTWLRDGEVFAQMVSGRINSLTPSAGVHFWLEALEPDFIPMTSDESNRLNQGVFVDDWGRPEKYLVYKSRPVSGRQMETKEVDAERMLHLKFVRRLHQMRGTSLLSGVLIRLSALKEYEDSELTAARIAAALGMYIRKGDGQSYETDGNDSKENERELTIQPGIIYDDLKPGEEIGMVKSDRPNPNLETFRNGQLRAVAAGSRLSFSSTARNYNGTYSAQRQELVESTDGYLILQDWFIGAVTRPMYRAWLKQAVASGVIRLPRDLDRSSLYTAVYSGPVMPWIDPVKEAEAWKIQIRGGAATESDWVRAGGRNPDDVKRRRKAEIDENRKLDLVFDTDPASDKGGSSAATKRQEPQHTDDQSEE